MEVEELIKELEKYPKDAQVKVQVSDIFVYNVGRVESADYYDDILNQDMKIVVLKVWSD